MADYAFACPDFRPDNFRSLNKDAIGDWDLTVRPRRSRYPTFAGYHCIYMRYVVPVNIRTSIGVMSSSRMRHLCSGGGLRLRLTLRTSRQSNNAAKRRFVEADQCDSTSPVPFAKIFPFPLYPNQIYIPCRPAPSEGRFAIVTDVGRGMRWTLAVLLTKALACAPPN